jgi:hypothetical protein
MMATFKDMQDRISDDLVNESITTTQIQNAILSSIKLYERRAFWFMQTVGTFSTVAAQEYYSTTDFADMANIKSIHSVLVTNVVKTPLNDADYNSVDAMQTGSVTGAPSHYTYYQKKLRLYPIPDAVYTVTISYTRQYAALSSDTDENDWTNEAEELIRQAAKRRLALDILHDTDMASRISTLEREAYDELLSENRRRSPKKTLTTNLPVGAEAFDMVSGL